MASNKKKQTRSMRPLNLVLIVFVLASAFSLWMAQGRPLPGWLDKAPQTVEDAVLPAGDAVLEPIHVRVLNATSLSGLAADFALLLPQMNCVVEGDGNAPPWPGGQCVLINRRLPVTQAEQLAANLGGLPLIREWDGRTTEDVVLVLGEDHAQVRDFILVGAQSDR